MTTCDCRLIITPVACLLLVASLFRGAAGQESGTAELPPHALVRLGTTKFLPTSGIDRLEYSADGKYLASVGIAEQGTVRPGVQIWDRRTGLEVTPEKLKSIEATGIAWAPTGHRFITSHRDDVLPAGLNLWTVGHNDSQPLVRRKDGFSTVAWSQEGDRIAARSWQDTIFLFDLNGKELHRIPVKIQKAFLSAHVIDFTQDGKHLAVIADPGVRVYDVESAKLMHIIPVTAMNLNGLRILPDGQTFGIATDKGVQTCRFDSTQPSTFPADHAMIDMVATRDGRWLIATDFSNDLTVWDRRTGDVVKLPQFRVQGGIAIAPDDSEVAISTRRISFLKVGSWLRLPTGEEHRQRISTGGILNDRFWTAEIGPELREWNVDTGNVLRTVARKSGNTRALAMIDNHQFAVAGDFPQIDIVDAKTGDVAKTLPGHNPSTTSLAFSKPHRRVMSTGTDGVVRAWDLDSGAMVYEVPAGERSEYSRAELVVAPNGDFFAYGNPETLQMRVFLLSNGKEMWSAKTMQSKFQNFWMPMVFTPDSGELISILATTMEPDGPTRWFIGRWDAVSGKERSRIDIGQVTMTSSLAISPDGRNAAFAIRTGDAEHGIQIWSLKEQRRIATLGSHLEVISKLCFTPDGKKLISTSQDTTALVWDVEAAILKMSQ